MRHEVFTEIALPGFPMNSRVLSRTSRSSASISSFSRTIWVSNGIGVFRRISAIRPPPSARGIACKMAPISAVSAHRSALRRMAFSMVIKWPTQFACRPSSFAGPRLPLICRTASAARKSSLCARSRFSDNGLQRWHSLMRRNQRDAQTVVPPPARRHVLSCSTRTSPNAGPKFAAHGQLPSIFPQGHGDPRNPARDPVTVKYQQDTSGGIVRPLPQFEGWDGE